MGNGKRDIGIVLVILLFVFLLSKGILFATTGLCFETDSGKDIYNKGILTTSNGVKLTDNCISSSTLDEFYCSSDGTGFFSPDIICPNGCLNGACIPPSCTPNWACNTWSTCTNNQQTRNCIDLNSCGTIGNNPALTQSCTVPDVCTQEAGQLCNPTTKQLVSYINGCQKSDFLIQGYTADLSICDQNQQVTCISNPQLLTHISSWVNNQITNQQLLIYISSWVNC